VVSTLNAHHPAEYRYQNLFFLRDPMDHRHSPRRNHHSRFGFQSINSEVLEVLESCITIKEHAKAVPKAFARNTGHAMNRTSQPTLTHKVSIRIGPGRHGIRALGVPSVNALVNLIGGISRECIYRKLKRLGGASKS
jgi:hypothetical protein